MYKHNNENFYANTKFNLIKLKISWQSIYNFQRKMYLFTFLRYVLLVMTERNVFTNLLISLNKTLS